MRKISIRSILSLKKTKNFGAKRRSRHKEAKAYHFWKMSHPGKKRIESPFW